MLTRQFGIVLVFIALLAFVAPAPAQVRISQVGKGAGTNVNAFNAQYIELFNAGPSPVSLEGMSVQWASVAGSASWTKVDLHGTIAPNGYWLVRTTGPLSFGVPFTPDQDRPVGFNGTPFVIVTYGDSAGKVVLSDTTTLFTTNGCAAPDQAHILDLVTWDDDPSTAACHEGSACALIPRRSGVGSTAVLRRCGGQTDVNDNLSDFMQTARPPRNSNFTGVVNAPAVNGVAEVAGKTGRGTATGYAGQSVLFTSTPTSCAGTLTGVAINLAPLGGSAAQTMFDDGSNGDATAGDGTYSFSYVIPPSAPLGTYALVLSASDSAGLAGTGVAPLTVAPTPPVNDLCGNAEVIPATALPVFASATGDLVSAGPITPVATSCTTGAGTSRDVWYSFTPVESGYYTVSTCNAVTAPGLFTSMSTNLTIFTTCPPDDATDLTGFALACNSNGCTNFIGGGPSTIAGFPMDAGTTYLIRVAKSGSGDGVVGAPFRLDIMSEPFGSCCLPNGSCRTVLQSTCNALGGTFWGEGTTCSTTTCPPAPPPSNNECTDAVGLALDVPVGGTTYGASGSDITTCDLTSWDVWYTYTPPAADPFRIDVTLLAGSQTPAISIFASCPPVTDANLACAVVPSAGVENSLAFSGLPGTTYFIRVATNFSQRSEFSVVVRAVPPPCDPDVNCDGAVNGFDIEAMEQAVNGDLSNFCQADPDFNHDGAVNGFDIEAVEQGVNGGPCP